MTLYNMKRNYTCTIMDVPNIRILDSLGVRPGIQIKIKNIQPFGGPVILQIGTRNVALGKDVASRINVEVN